MKLHLGSGGNYLQGYINIDFPPKNSIHQIKADQFADIRTLKYKSKTISEIRMHHVFEHFTRSEAYALIGIWSSWLEEGGILRIEVPDFEKNTKNFFKTRKNLLLRHIFGSQEASWANHYHGWTKAEFQKVLPFAEFKNLKFKAISYKGMQNIEVIAKKSGLLEKDLFINAIENYLSTFLVDKSESELNLKKVWLSNFTKLLNKSFANEN